MVFNGGAASLVARRKGDRLCGRWVSERQARLLYCYRCVEWQTNRVGQSEISKHCRRSVARRRHGFRWNGDKVRRRPLANVARVLPEWGNASNHERLE